MYSIANMTKIIYKSVSHQMIEISDKIILWRESKLKFAAMQIIFILIAISISLALFFLFSFLWATRSGQFEDTYGPAVRILFDDEVSHKKSMSNKKTEPCN